MTTTLKPEDWIPASFMGLATFIINGIIFKKEYENRRRGIAKFTTKYLKLWSFICIIIGPIAGICIFTYYLDGFCYISWYIFCVICMSQPAFMGFYQLSKLHYCFAKSKVYSNRGYPDYLFIIMYLIGFIGILSIFILPIFWGQMRTVCGINKNFHCYMRFKSFGSHKIFNIWYIILISIYICWDLTTMLLYALKIRSFRKYKTENIEIYRRILSILYRIFILTLFYQIMTVIAGLVVVSVQIGAEYYNIYILFAGLPSFIFTYSMFLMLQHNTTQYINFLKFLHNFKLDYLCCYCCRSVIIIQLNELELTTETDLATNIDNNNENKCKQMEDTEYETHDISENHAKIEAKGYELSVETTMTNM